MTPRIGITTYLEPARWGAWDLRAALLPELYLDAVVRAGGRPMLLPPVDLGAAETIEVLDALVLAGGADLDPAGYGADPHPETAGVRPDQDQAELSLLRQALARDLPVLGVCRGMQLLNVGLGGDLVQHLDDHRPAPGQFVRHRVEFEPGTRAAAILGDAVEVESSHHQGLGRLGDGLVVSGRSSDGVVEAVEHPGHRFVLGVQWHPEADAGDLRLFKALVEACR